MMGRRICIGALLALAAVAAAGCGSQGTGGVLSGPPEDTAGVFVHWDAWTPYEAPEYRYTRRYEAFTDHLIPAGDYGTLIPFTGKAVEGWMGPSYLYGLVTEKGEVVVDPVYSSIYRMSEYDGETSEMIYRPYLVLSRGTYDPAAETGVTEITVAAADGSWCREGYRRAYGCTEDYFVAGTADGGVEVLTAQGEVLWRKSAQELELPEMLELYGESFILGSETMCYWSEDTSYFVSLADGSITKCPVSEAGTPNIVYREDLIAASIRDGSDYRYGCVDHTGAWVIEPVYTSMDLFRGGYAIVEKENGTWALIDETGAERLSCTEGELFRTWDEDGNIYYINAAEDGTETYGGYWEFWLFHVIRVWDEALEPCDMPLTSGDRIVWRYNGTWLKLGDGEAVIGWGAKQIKAPVPEGYFLEETYRCGSAVAVRFQAEDLEAGIPGLCGLYDEAGREIVAPGTYGSFGVCGADRISAYAYSDSGPTRMDVLDGEGNVCFSFDGGIMFYQLPGSELMVYGDDVSTGLCTAGGEWVFRWPILNGDI